MEMSPFDVMPFALASVLSAGLYVWISWRQGALPAWVRGAVELRLHHMLVGLVMGYTCLPPLRNYADRSIPLLIVFLSCWFAMAIGCSIDLRMLRRIAVQTIVVEVVPLFFLLLFLLLMVHTTEVGQRNGEAILWAIGGVAAASWSRQKWSGQKKRSRARSHWMPSLAATVGLGLLGAASMYSQGGKSIIIYRPFATSIVVDGFMEQALGSLCIGVIIGLLIDLSMKGADERYFPYLLAGGLMLGAGVGASVALEPMWIGGVAGFWIINTTLRRVDVLDLLERGAGGLNVALSSVAGWVLGAKLYQREMEISLFFWSVLLFLSIPAIRLLAWRVVGMQWGRSVQKGMGTGQWLKIDDLGLVAALALSVHLPGASAAAVLAALICCQLVFVALRVVAKWVPLPLAHLIVGGRDPHG